MQTLLMIIGFVIVAFAVLLAIARSKMKNIPLVADHEKILTLTEKNFQQQTKNKVVLVDFWAAWCAPCRMMAPILNDVANELSGGSHIGKVDIEHNESLARKFEVRSIPTMVLFRNGKEIQRFVGLKSKEYLLEQIHKA
jgi:thioredoxin 1